MSGKGSGFRGRNALGRILDPKFLLACGQTNAQSIHVDAGGACPGKNPLRRPFFFADVMLDLLRKHLYLAGVKLILRVSPLDLCD